MDKIHYKPLKSQLNQAFGGGQSPEIDLKEAKAKTSEEAFEASGLKITKEDVKAAQGEAGIRTSAKTKERVAKMYNDCARQILTECGDNIQLKALASECLKSLPKSSRGGDLQLYRAECNNVLYAFRSAARDMGMQNFLREMEENADDRFVQSEVAADNRQAGLKTTIETKGDQIINDVNANTDQREAETQAVVKDEGKKGRAETRRQAAINRVHQTKVGENIIKGVTRNVSGALGVDLEGYTVKNADGDRVLYNGFVVADKDSVVGKNLHNMRVFHGVDDDNCYLEYDQVQQTTDGKDFYHPNTTLRRVDDARDDIKEHTTRQVDRGIKDNRTQHKETRQAVQYNNVLQAKRQTLSDMLGHEDRENFGVYRDSTVKWLGGSADKILSNDKLNQKQKEEALDELVRMADEENIISDGDKKEFNEKYKLQ